MIDPFETPKPSIDFLILADRAEIIGQKLYTMGGGWDRIGVADFANPAHLSFAAGVIVPWALTNTEHTILLTMQDMDGNELAMRIEMKFSVGRPADLRDGDTQRFMLAVPGAGVRFPGPGTYFLVATLNGEKASKTRFSTVQGAPHLGTSVQMDSGL